MHADKENYHRGGESPPPPLPRHPWPLTDAQVGEMISMCVSPKDAQARTTTPQGHCPHCSQAVTARSLPSCQWNPYAVSTVPLKNPKSIHRPELKSFSLQGEQHIPFGSFAVDDKALISHDLLLFRNTQFLALTRSLLEDFSKSIYQMSFSKIISQNNICLSTAFSIVWG